MRSYTVASISASLGVGDGSGAVTVQAGSSSTSVIVPAIANTFFLQSSVSTSAHLPVLHIPYGHKAKALASSNLPNINAKSGDTIIAKASASVLASAESSSSGKFNVQSSVSSNANDPITKAAFDFGVQAFSSLIANDLGKQVAVDINASLEAEVEASINKKVAINNEGSTSLSASLKKLRLKVGIHPTALAKVTIEAHRGNIKAGGSIILSSIGRARISGDVILKTATTNQLSVIGYSSASAGVPKDATLSASAQSAAHSLGLKAATSNQIFVTSQGVVGDLSVKSGFTYSASISKTSKLIQPDIKSASKYDASAGASSTVAVTLPKNNTISVSAVSDAVELFVEAPFKEDLIPLRFKTKVGAIDVGSAVRHDGSIVAQSSAINVSATGSVKQQASTTAKASAVASSPNLSVFPEITVTAGPVKARTDARFEFGNATTINASVSGSTFAFLAGLTYPYSFSSSITALASIPNVDTRTKVGATAVNVTGTASVNVTALTAEPSLQTVSSSAVVNSPEIKIATVETAGPAASVASASAVLTIGDPTPTTSDFTVTVVGAKSPTNGDFSLN